MKIGWKLLSTLGTATAACALVGVFSVTNLDRLQGYEDQISRKNVGSLEALLQLQEKYLTLRLEVRDFLLRGDPTQVPDFEARVRPLHDDFDASLRTYSALEEGRSADQLGAFRPTSTPTARWSKPSWPGSRPGTSPGPRRPSTAPGPPWPSGSRPAWAS